MIYRTLGNTGLKVSQLGFGAMRLPMRENSDVPRVDDELATEMIHHAFENGLNYIDTAVMYCDHDSQRAVGKALKGWRDKIVVSTKNHCYGTDEKEWWGLLEDSLRLLQVDYLDLYHHHGVNWQSYCENIEPRVSKWMMKARDQGLVKHICCSFHDNSEALFKLIDTGYPEVLTVQYNLLDRSLEDAIAHAHEKGIGVVVMGPVGGGRLGEPSEVLKEVVSGVKQVPELALRFVLSNPNVTLALSGMSTLQQVKENLATASDPTLLTESDRQSIDQHMIKLRKLAELYCTGCRYCLPCPHEVMIPNVFDCYNRGRVYGLWNSARQGYAEIGNVPWLKGQNASACTECGECEDKCPQHIPIRKQLKEAHQALTGLAQDN